MDMTSGAPWVVHWFDVWYALCVHLCVVCIVCSKKLCLSMINCQAFRYFEAQIALAIVHAGLKGVILWGDYHCFWPRRLSRAGRKIWVIKTDLFSGNWQLVELRGKPRDDDTGSGSLLGGALAGNWSSALLMDLRPPPKAKLILATGWFWSKSTL